jgi:hypothetical protein
MLRPKRLNKAISKASERASNALLVSQIVDSKVQKKRKLHVLEPMPAEQLTEPAILDWPLPIYRPPLQLHSFNSHPRARPQSPLEAFQLFITHEIVDIIVTNTNSYADNKREEFNANFSEELRSWKPITHSEIWRYFSCLFYMGLHTESKRDDY